MNLDQPAATVLKLVGELNIYAAAALHARLQATLVEGGPLELDLSEVSELDSAGVQQLLLLKRECELTGRALRVSAVSDAANAVLTLLNLRQQFA
ncbi:MAG: anti-sigma factor antagonist [Gammaproteobacteria bacterium]|nr:anti-sigma factor antagonist [Gammaproteobacteria bacterium]